MSFPTTSVIDNFNRADGGLGAAWQADSAGDSALAILTNQIVGVANLAAAAYTVAKYANNQEAFVDVPVVDATAGAFVQLNLRADGLALNNVYFLRYHHDTGQWEFRKRVAGGASAQFGTPVTQAITAGDTIGFSVIGSTLTAYRKTGGVWTQIMQTVDSSVPGTGGDLIGMQISSGASALARLDNFGGGVVAHHLAPSVAAGIAPGIRPGMRG